MARGGGHRGNTRGTYSLNPAGIGHRTVGGAPVLSLRRLRLSAFTETDAGSRLASATTDGGEGSGWSISLTGGLGAITDPFDAVYWIAPARGLFGDSKIASADHMWALQFQIIERTSPGLSTDFNVAIGVCNESSDSGTIDALVGGIRYATNRQSTGTQVANGSASTQVVNAANMRGCVFAMVKKGLSSGARVNMTGQNAVDAALANVDANVGAAGLTCPNFGDSEPYLVVAAWRSAVTAGTATGAFDFYAGAGLTVRYAT